MTVAHSIHFPGSRVLAGWWRRLAPLNPVGLWIGTFLFHGVEAPVRVTRLNQLPRFARLILQGLDCVQDRTVSGLANLLLLDQPAVLQVLRSLERDALIEAEESGVWRLTMEGRRGLQEGIYLASHLERRLFTFVQVSENKNPAYVHLQKNIPTRSALPSSPRFEVAWLTQCLQQTPEWKKSRHFPEEVVQLLTPSDRAGSESPQQPMRAFSNGAERVATPSPLWDWQCVILADAWRQSVAITLTQNPGQKECLLGFPVEGPQWDLDEKKPMFTLFDSWREVFDELTEDPPKKLWVQAWRDWCQPRGFAVGDTSHGLIGKAGHKLQVVASRRLMEQLRVQRSDALKGKAWLLAGTDQLRTAGLLEIVEKDPAKPAR